MISELLSNNRKIKSLLGMDEVCLKDVLIKLKEVANKEGISRLDIISIKSYYEFRPYKERINSMDFTDERSLVGLNKFNQIIDSIINEL